jgi:hypothetical protein
MAMVPTASHPNYAFCLSREMTIPDHSVEKERLWTGPIDFSLVQGGPLFQLYVRSHLSGSAMEFLVRRIVVIPLFAWLPLLILSIFDGHVFGGSIQTSFLRDVEAHVRFLVALPILIGAEVVVHHRLRSAVQLFVQRGIVVSEDRPRFRAAIDSALRVRNSVAVEVGLLAFVYSVGLWSWRTNIALASATWYATPEGGSFNLTHAGYWYVLVSIPISQFLLLRWYIRLVVWFRFLWRVSRLNLHLTAAHPDRAGGIGFLGRSSYAFGPILFAQGALLSALFASRILHEGQSLMTFKLEAVGIIVLVLLCILGPLAMFTPALDRAKRQGLAEYGLLANQYVFGFEEKWIQKGPPETGELLGTGDIQSLADLVNSYSAVREMRILPFGAEDIVRLAGITAAPLLPLGLTMFSFEELVTHLVKMVF